MTFAGYKGVHVMPDFNLAGCSFYFSLTKYSDYITFVDKVTVASSGKSCTLLAVCKFEGKDLCWFLIIEEKL